MTTLFALLPAVSAINEISWFSVWQTVLATVIAACLVAVVFGVFKAGKIVGRWYLSNENRMQELEDARRRARHDIGLHGMRLDEVEGHLGDNNPEFRQRIRQLIRDGKLPDRRVSDKR